MCLSQQSGQWGEMGQQGNLKKEPSSFFQSPPTVYDNECWLWELTVNRLPARVPLCSHSCQYCTKPTVKLRLQRLLRCNRDSDRLEDSLSSGSNSLGKFPRCILSCILSCILNFCNGTAKWILQESPEKLKNENRCAEKIKWTFMHVVAWGFVWWHFLFKGCSGVFAIYMIISHKNIAGTNNQCVRSHEGTKIFWNTIQKENMRGNGCEMQMFWITGINKCSTKTLTSPGLLFWCYLVLFSGIQPIYITIYWLLCNLVSLIWKSSKYTFPSAVTSPLLMFNGNVTTHDAQCMRTSVRLSVEFELVLENLPVTVLLHQCSMTRLKHTAIVPIQLLSLSVL